MGDIAFSEMLIIVLVIIVLFGPKKLPQIARDLGQGVRKMRGAMEDIKTEILKETDNPVSEIKQEIEKVKNSITSFDHTAPANVNDLSKPVASTQTAAAPVPVTPPSSNADDQPAVPHIDQLSDQYEGPVSR